MLRAVKWNKGKEWMPLKKHSIQGQGKKNNKRNPEEICYRGPGR